MTFPCTSCGACCTALHLAGRPELAELPKDKDGNCAHLNGKLCGIYDRRPHCCKVDDIYSRNHFHLARIGIPTRGDFYRETAVVCNQLQATLGLNPKYRITERSLYESAQSD